MDRLSPAQKALAFLPANFSDFVLHDTINDYFYRSYAPLSSSSQSEIDKFMWTLMENEKFSYQIFAICKEFSNPPIVRSVLSCPTFHPKLIKSLLLSRKKRPATGLNGFYSDELELLLTREELTLELLATVIISLAGVNEIGVVLRDAKKLMLNPLTFDDIVNLYFMLPDDFLESDGFADGEKQQVRDLLIEIAASKNETFPVSWVREMFASFAQINKKEQVHA